MTYIFSAGNDGPGGHISSPGTAKNVITVAASENYRPEGFDSCDLDGQGGVGSDGADNALDILRFSSGGPTNDGRSKPDVSAPGTHEYGAASQSPFYNASGLCPGLPNYNPPGDPQYYTNSSGTSLAAPHVTGAAALVRQFFTQNQLLPSGAAPSPAMIKAYLVNSATYMSGDGAGGNLPGQRQGWGLLNLGRAFDGTARLLVDQTTLFANSGQTFQYSGSLADRSKPLRVTLAWTDAPGMPGAAPWVNDLDLELTVGGVTLYRGNNFTGAFSVAGGDPDRINNVESIFIPPSAIPEGVSGNFTVVVRAVNIAGDGVPGNATVTDQDFALVVYNVAAPIIPPPPPTPAITAASYAGKLLTVTGHDFTAAAQVEINSTLITQPFDFDTSTNSLSIRLKRRKLNLADGNNVIVVIENGTRSAPFVLPL
jgi:subtilisin family serine protease